MMRSTALAATWLIVCGYVAAPSLRAADQEVQLERVFSQTVRPFLGEYCAGCHSGAAPAAQFDLRQFTTVAEVLRDYPHWNLLLEKLTAAEMPPKAVKQPPAASRQAVIDW